MTLLQIQAILPVIILSGTALLILLLISFYRSQFLTVLLSSIGFIASMLSLVYMPDAAKTYYTLLSMDKLAVFFTGIIIAASFAVSLISYGYFKNRSERCYEFYVLLLLATAGACILASAAHFASLFLGLEIMSVSLYAMIAYFRNEIKNIEAGIKYLMLAAASSAFLLFGMALVYMETGSLDFAGISQAFSATAQTYLTYFALCFLVTGIGFKLAVVPFHIWTPDVYDGAPAPVTAFIASVSKGAMFAIFVRFFTALNGRSDSKLLLIFAVISIASMFAGNLLALRQNNIKRLLAYSSIAHIGYALVAVMAGGSRSYEAAMFYFASYFVTTIAAFGVVAAVSDESDACLIADYKSLAWKSPFAGLVLTASLLSLAGIPLTSGFIGKYYLAVAGIQGSMWLLVSMLLLNSAIGIYYYLKVIVALYENPAGKPVKLKSLSMACGIALAFLLLMIIWIGIYPQTLIDILD